MENKKYEHLKQIGETTPEYIEFIEKFKPKKTTDDCYTPEHIYKTISDWAIKEYGLHGREIIRPFWPTYDYKTFEYPTGCVVIDNPPFSILSKIIDFYTKNKIDYFLFAPALTLFSAVANRRANAIITNSTITYENGAEVKTAFITNMGEYKIHVSHELYEIIDRANKQYQNKNKTKPPKYKYPNNIITSALIQKIANHGQSLKIKSDDCCFVRKLDMQNGKTIYGGGFLLSEKAAAEKAAAEKAAAEKAAAEKENYMFFDLSEREKQIIKRLGSK